jgi:hypothetical protein
VLAAGRRGRRGTELALAESAPRKRTVEKSVSLCLAAERFERVQECRARPAPKRPTLNLVEFDLHGVQVGVRTRPLECADE